MQSALQAHRYLSIFLTSLSQICGKRVLSLGVGFVDLVVLLHCVNGDHLLFLGWLVLCKICRYLQDTP